MEFWKNFYDGVREVFFSDRVYVLREVLREPKTIGEISEKTGIPYVTVRKYLTWAKSKAVATVVGTKKEKSKLAELWLLTFEPKVLELKEVDMLIVVKVKVLLRKIFCEVFCPLKDSCPHYEKLSEVRPYRIVEFEKAFVRSVDEVCKVE